MVKYIEEKLSEVIAKKLKNSIKTTIPNNDRPQTNVSCSVLFFITGVHERLGHLCDLHESDSSLVNSIFSFLNDSNINSIRRLGKRKYKSPDTNSSTKLWQTQFLVTFEKVSGWVSYASIRPTIVSIRLSCIPGKVSHFR